jgi:hypothetical protein
MRLKRTELDHMFRLVTRQIHSGLVQKNTQRILQFHAHVQAVWHIMYTTVYPCSIKPNLDSCMSLQCGIYLDSCTSLQYWIYQTEFVVIIFITDCFCQTHSKFAFQLILEEY